MEREEKLEQEELEELHLLLPPKAVAIVGVVEGYRSCLQQEVELVLLAQVFDRWLSSSAKEWLQSSPSDQPSSVL